MMTFKRLALLFAALATSVSAQQPARRSTNLAALLAYPAFYHQRPILLVGKVALQNNGDLTLTDDAGTMRIVFKGSAPDGEDEIRGEFWDLGRMGAEDPRLRSYDLRTTFRIDPDAPWPRPGQVTAIVATAITAATPPPAPSIRAMVLYPSRYLDQKITLTGQFGGRNLLGDLADAPAKSRYDFVLRSADAAIWVVNIRPRGKDFELALDARIDTGRWLEVRGTVQEGRGLQWLDAEPNSLKLAKPPTETTLEAPIRVPAAPPPEVVFSAPTQDETDVGLVTHVRIQFSRDINPTTFRGRIVVKYAEAETIERGEPVTPTVQFTTQYSPGGRVLELRFAQPLERFRTVHVELMDGILGMDLQPLKPWTLTFLTGGA